MFTKTAKQTVGANGPLPGGGAAPVVAARQGDVATATVFDNDLLINQQTGDLDVHEINRRAVRLAGVNPSPREVRQCADIIRDKALILRRRWRAAHGLPDDTVYEMVEMPAWGASGDGFERAV